MIIKNLFKPALLVKRNDFTKPPITGASINITTGMKKRISLALKLTMTFLKIKNAARTIKNKNGDVTLLKNLGFQE